MQKQNRSQLQAHSSSLISTNESPNAQQLIFNFSNTDMQAIENTPPYNSAAYLQAFQKAQGDLQQIVASLANQSPPPGVTQARWQDMQQKLTDTLSGFQQIINLFPNADPMAVNYILGRQSDDTPGTVWGNLNLAQWDAVPRS